MRHGLWLVLACTLARTQNPEPQDPVQGIVMLFETYAFYLPFRDEFYASVVRYQVLAKERRALLIMGEGHFRRSGGRPGAIESELLTALVKPYVIIAGSNMVRGYDDLAPRFDAPTAPSLVEMKGNWIGSLPAPGAEERWARGTTPRILICILDHETG